MAVVTRERLIEGTASPESEWLDWLRTAELSAWSGDRCLTPALRLVVLAPHPDDELLMCGGLLAQHAQAGWECLIVGVTDGEASQAGSAAWSADRLSVARAVERQQGLARLGLTDAKVRRLGLPDGKLGQYRPALMAMLSALLRPDDVAVTTWRLDGHPDHVSAALASRCDRLLVTDGSRNAVDLATARLAGLPHVEVRQAWIPEQWPIRIFDLIVLSEFGFYMDGPQLDAVAAATLASLGPDGTVLACHWRRPVGAGVLDGDQVHRRLAERLALPVLCQVTEPDLRIDVWCRDPASVAQREGFV